MRFADVDLPEELVDAHRRGDLVIFVGAGASIAPPSSLPSFWKLTEEIALDAGVVMDPNAKDLDRILGQADKDPLVGVHQRVADRIDDPSSEPNDLHKAIASLAAVSPFPRIVTTNYDRHLSTALASRGLAEFAGPALPMGNDFNGIVYLHGTLTQEPRHLICTDKDFGRAYLLDAWAARFLERMFARYTVLFIGYSHDDVVMSYLGRALGPESRRYAFTPAPAAPNWELLNITTIPYEVIDRSHEALTDVITKWADRAAMGLLQHRQYVAELVRAAPSGVPEEESYLRSILADPAKAGFFTEHARGRDWLAWTSASPEFTGLFAGTSDSQTLADWYAQHFVLVEEHTEAALQVMQEAGGRLGPAVWTSVAARLNRLTGVRPRWIRPWLALLLRDAPDFASRLLDLALARSDWRDDRHTALLLFEHLAEPWLNVRPGLGTRKSTFEISIHGDLHMLTAAWKEVFRPHLAEAARELIAIADIHLRRANHLLATAGMINEDWDPLSYGRAAIEPHEQDQFRRPIDVLVDAARDCLEALLPEPAGLAYLESWERSDVLLLRRLAVHGWVHREDMDAGAKLAHLRDAGWLFDVPLRHEAYELLKVTVGSAEPDVTDSVVATVMAEESEAENFDYQKFLLLGWILGHAPGLASAVTALAQIQLQHPDYQQREHPNFLRWTEGGLVSPRLPTAPAQFHVQIEADTAGAVAWLRRQKEAHDPFTGFHADGSLQLVASTVRENPGDGLRLLDAAGEDDADIVAAVINGWSGTTLDNDTAATIVRRLRDRDLTPITRETASMLAEGARGPNRPTPWAEISGSQELAVALWDTLPPDPIDAPSSRDWLTEAINQPAGWLTQFWLEVIGTQWRADTDAWTGLPDPLRAQLETLIASPDERGALAQVILASRLHFLHGADPAWTEATILPLLAWDEEQRARRCWDGYLSWGRFNNRLLDAGLLDAYLTAIQHIDMFPEDLARQLLDHLASVAIYADTDPIADGWVNTFTRAAGADLRAQWFERISWLLAELDTTSVEHQWTRWMRTYWQDRLHNTPIGLSDDEASALATWTAYLTNSIAEAVGLAKKHPAHLQRNSRFLDDLDSRVDQAPVVIAALLVHLMQGTESPFCDSYQISTIINSLERHSVDVSPLREQLLRLQNGNI